MSISLRNTLALLLVALTCSKHATYAQTLPVPSHIIVLFEENYAYSQIIGSSSAPHINALAADPHAAVFTQFYAIEHPSQPNYLDVFSGNNQGITDDGLPSTEVADYPFTTPNLCIELLAAGKTFKTFSEDLPAVGSDVQTYTHGSANYARKHNPCANWVGTGTNEFSDTVNQPYAAFPTNYASLPTVSFVVPNMTNDMHDYTCGSLPCAESITIGDTWIYNNLDSLRSWSIANNTLYIVVYDEDDDNHDNNIPVIFYGPMVKAGTYTENVNLYNLLHTVESMYGLSHAGNSATSTSITDCWLTTTGVNNIVNTNLFKVMPNPATDVINFTSDNILKTQVTINVTNETGHTVVKSNMTGTNLQVNTSAFGSGVYIYKIFDDTNNLITEGKFIITRN